MVLRLSVLTGLMALFAVSFSALVHSQTRTPGGPVASVGCFDQGVVCARSSFD